MHIGDCHCEEPFDITQDKLCDEAISLDSPQAPSQEFILRKAEGFGTGFGMTPFVRLLRKTCLERIERARGKHFEAISFITVGARCSVPLLICALYVNIYHKWLCYLLGKHSTYLTSHRGHRDLGVFIIREITPLCSPWLDKMIINSYIPAPPYRTHIPLLLHPLLTGHPATPSRGLYDTWCWHHIQPV